jgi:hypothetical protein
MPLADVLDWIWTLGVTVEEIRAAGREKRRLAKVKEIWRKLHGAMDSGLIQSGRPDIG